MMMGRMGRLPILGRTVAAPIGAAARHAEKGTLFGLLAGIGMLSAAIALGGSAKSFVDLPSPSRRASMACCTSSFYSISKRKRRFFAKPCPW